MDTVWESSWKIFVYTTALLLAVIVGASLQQRANDSLLEQVSVMGPLEVTRISMAASSGARWLNSPVTVRYGVPVERPWVGVVSSVEGENAFINGGSDHGLAVGMLLDVTVHGKRLVDPETGLTIGSVTEKIGQLRVVDVEQHASEATIVEGCEGLGPGARVELRHDGAGSRPKLTSRATAETIPPL